MTCANTEQIKHIPWFAKAGAACSIVPISRFVAIIRPGPIVGKMMNPYMERRQGRQEVTYPHPLLEPVLRRTLGVPLFQEQLLRIATTIADFTVGEAEKLRRALGSRRSADKMRALELKLRKGMDKNQVGLPAQEEIIQSISSFALYGFLNPTPRASHSSPMQVLAQVHYLGAFTAAILNNQPMGFYSAAVLVKDAQRRSPSAAHRRDAVMLAVYVRARRRRFALDPSWPSLCAWSPRGRCHRA